MKMTKRILAMMMVVAVGLSLSSTTRAQITNAITVSNFSFESPFVSSGSILGVPTSWDSGGNPNFIGVQTGGLSGLTGNQYVFIAGPLSISVSPTTIAANTTYVLSVDVSSGNELFELSLWSSVSASALADTGNL